MILFKSLENSTKVLTWVRDVMWFNSETKQQSDLLSDFVFKPISRVDKEKLSGIFKLLWENRYEIYLSQLKSCESQTKERK